MLAKCEVCQINPPVGVASSALGAYAMAICGECLKMHAEPEFIFETTAWTCGSAVNDGVRCMTTFKDGAYISWDVWYTAHGEAAAARFDKSYAEYEAERAERQENESGRDESPI